MKLLNLNPTPGALTAEPFTAVEIDAHPDADRIWATILAMRLHLDEELGDAYDAGYSEGKSEVAA